LLKVLRGRAVRWEGQAGQVDAIEREPVVGTGHGGLVLTEVVLEGRKPQSGAELLRGYPGLLGAHLS
jgi:methionyl-tRNA formyltransferase